MNNDIAIFSADKYGDWQRVDVYRANPKGRLIVRAWYGGFRLKPGWRKEAIARAVEHADKHPEAVSI